MGGNTVQISFFPEGKTFSVTKGRTLLELADSVGINLNSLCGGRHKCGKCKVRFRYGAPAPSQVEIQKLLPEELEAGYRLACACVMEIDAAIEALQDFESIENAAILSSGVSEHSFALDSGITKVMIQVPKPSIQEPRSDIELINSALINEGSELCGWVPSIVRDIPEKLRSFDSFITCAGLNGRILSIERGDTRNKVFGVAIDIGTTTIVGYLLDLFTGSTIGVEARINPQRVYGSDVISRVSATIESPESLQTLQRLVLDCISDLIKEIVSRSGVDQNHIYKMSVVGNTCMLHLFWGVSPRSLALSPYTPVFTNSLFANAGDLGLAVNPCCEVRTLPIIAGFVGADTLAVLLNSRIHESESVKLVLDLGTNGEIALGSRKGLIVCSTAAGPAFEGEHIQCGMIAAPGAIDEVIIGEELYIHTIHNAPAKGICGSGLVDSIAEMVKIGILDKRGRFTTKISTSGARVVDALSSRLIEQNGSLGFVLADSGEKAERRVVLTQRDVQEFQVAKGAIFAGIQVLMEEMNIKASDISEVLIAGGFGNYIKKESLSALGMLPPLDMDRVRSIGNAAGEGAKTVLMSNSAVCELNRILEKTEYIELSAHTSFTKKFTRSLLFP
jgi:uncharacterized 2Fe-2S/4Fe-4S cluster protein (DUF4445 family)